MRFKKLIVVIFGIFALVSCKFVCDTQKVIAEGLTSGIANGLQCSNRDQIQKDVEGILGVANICASDETKKQGTIAMIVCPIVANAAVTYLGTKIPENWGCSPASAQITVAAMISQFCMVLPF